MFLQWHVPEALQVPPDPPLWQRASLPAHLRLLKAIAAHKPAVAERAAIALIETARGDIEADIASDEHFLVEGIA